MYNKDEIFWNEAQSFTIKGIPEAGEKNLAVLSLKYFAHKNKKGTMGSWSLECGKKTQKHH